MNINDIEPMKDLPEDLLGFIFAEQRKLMETYEKIEADNGLLTTSDIPVDLHDKMGQARLKDFAWRCTEEIAEALEAYERDQNHAKEEVADALHFLVEFTILAGVGPEDLNDEWVSTGGFANSWDQYGKLAVPSPMGTLMIFIRDLGCTCNNLKNKPWKVTHMLTDVEYFKAKLIDAWVSFAFLAISFGITTFEEMFQLYFRKSRVNLFRQRTSY